MDKIWEKINEKIEEIQGCKLSNIESFSHSLIKLGNIIESTEAERLLVNKITPIQNNLIVNEEKINW